MYDVDTLEAINAEQLATATDRLLFRADKISRRRPIVPSLAPSAQLARGTQPHIVVPARHSQPYLSRLACGSQPHIVVRAQGSQPRIVVPADGSQDIATEDTVAHTPARGSQSQLERTVVVRPRAQRSGMQVFAVTVVIPALVGIAVGLAALL